jgi:hypothetical protein
MTEIDVTNEKPVAASKSEQQGRQFHMFPAFLERADRLQLSSEIQRLRNKADDELQMAELAYSQIAKWQYYKELKGFERNEQAEESKLLAELATKYSFCPSAGTVLKMKKEALNELHRYSGISSKEIEQVIDDHVRAFKMHAGARNKANGEIRDSQKKLNETHAEFIRQLPQPTIAPLDEATVQASKANDEDPLMLRKLPEPISKFVIDERLNFLALHPEERSRFQISPAERSELALYDASRAVARALAVQEAVVEPASLQPVEPPPGLPEMPPILARLYEEVVTKKRKQVCGSTAEVF